MTELPQIINWRRLSEKVTTSGQPTEAQLEQIKGLGVTDVINLGPHSNDGALPDEPGSLSALGLTYSYIPVDFDNPTEADFEAFCAALDRLKDKTIHVHCIYNARVSAFFYRLAIAREGETEEAFENMDGIWRPGGVWADFIDKPEDAKHLNRYAGYDY